MIPKTAKEIIKTIWEKTGKKHSDEEIYSLLKECDMDSNEAIQKLQYLDTFQEVKRKPNRNNQKKEAPQQGGTGATRGNYSNNYKSAVGRVRNASSRRENDITYKGSSSLSVIQKDKSNAASDIARTPTSASNETANLSNGSSSHEHLFKVPADNNKGAKEALPDQKKESGDPTAVLAVKESANTGSTRTWASLLSGQYKPLPSSNQSLTTTAASLPTSKRSSTSIPPRLPSLNQSSTSTAAPLPSSNRSSTPTTAPLPNSNRSSTPTTATLPSSNRSLTSTTASVSGTPSSASGPVSAVGTISSEENHIEGSKAISNVPNPMPKVKVPSRSNTTEQNGPSAFPLKPSPSETITSKVTTEAVTDDSKLLPRSSAPEGRYVTFPSHFPASGALKIGLTFGSFSSTSELGITHKNGTGHRETAPTDPVESSQGSDVNAEESTPRLVDKSTPSNQIASSAKQGDTSERPPTPPVFEQVPESDSSIPSPDNLKNMQPNQEVKLQVESSPSLNVKNGPSYNLGFMEPQSTSQYVRLDGPEAQPHGVSSFSNFMNDNSSAPSSSTPPLSTSVAGPPQFPRQPLPPNYFSYGHYQIPPYLMPPVHPQFYSASGLPQQPSTSNIYHSSGALASQVKLSPHAVFRPGTAAGSAAHMSIPSGYGSFNTLPFGLNHIPAETSSGHTTKEDLVASQLKENHSYMTGSGSERSGPWVPTSGQGLSSVLHSSMYNHHPFHGHHVAYSPAPAGHGSFTGLYQAPQTMGAPSNANQLLQSQLMEASSEITGPPNGYEQPHQGAQSNWNTNY